MGDVYGDMPKVSHSELGWSDSGESELEEGGGDDDYYAPDPDSAYEDQFDLGDDEPKKGHWYPDDETEDPIQHDDYDDNSDDEEVEIDLDEIKKQISDAVGETLSKHFN